MVQFKVTPQLKAKLAGLVPQAQYEKLSSEEFISHSHLVEIFNAYKPTPTLLDLIKCTSMHIPNRNVADSKPKTKEYLELMQRLRKEQSEKEYKTLVKPKKQYDTLYENVEDDTITPAQMQKELKSNLTTIVNILISVGSVVYAIWYWTDTSWKLPNSWRVLMCLFFGILVLVAEVVVYLGYLNKIETARTVERNKKEVKKVIKTL